MRDIKRRKNAIDGRQALIDATLLCLANHGYQKSTVRKIAETANVTSGLLKHYFVNKAELMLASYDYFQSSALEVYTAEAEKSGEDPLVALEAFIRSLFYYNNDKGRHQMKIWVCFLELVMTDQNIAKKQAEHYELMIDIYIEFMHKVFLIKNKALDQSEAKELALGVNSIVDGLWLECSLNPDRITSEHALEIALKFIHKNILH